MKPKRKRQNYPKEFRDDAVKLVIEKGYNCTEVLDYITYYNSLRLHSTLGYKTPLEYEKKLFRKVA